MSLSGNLEVFPLDEVLRLLGRSRKTGCLRIESSGLSGRIYLDAGGLALATVVSDDEFRDRLLAAGLVEQSEIRRVELSGTTIADALAAGATSAALSDLVREESVEGLYRIRHSGKGNFDFMADLSPRYPTGQSFDIEVIVSESERRTLEWRDVESVLPDLGQTLRMVPVLADDEAVTLSASTWGILAALGSGTTTYAVARTIGWSDFRAAREMASLLRNSLVEVVAPPAEVSEPVSVQTPTEPAVASESGVAETSPAVEEPLIQTGPANEEGTGNEWAASPGEENATTVAGPHPAGTIDEEISQFEEAAESVQDSRTEVQAPDQPYVGLDEPSLVDSPTAESVSDVPVSAESATWWSDPGDEPGAAKPDEQPDPRPDERADEPVTPWASAPWSQPDVASEAAIQSTPWGGSVRPDDVAEVEKLDEAAAAPIESETETHGAGGWWARSPQESSPQESSPQEPGEAQPDSPSDGEADRFLESVFTSLSEEDAPKPDETPADDETGFGMGLLRRRRMGAASRDIVDDKR